MSEGTAILTLLAAIAAVVASLFSSKRDRFKAMSAKNLRLMMDENPAPIFLVGSDGLPTYQNKAAAAIYGYRIGQHFREWTHPDDLLADEEKWRGLLAHEYPSYRILKRHVRPEIEARGLIPDPNNPDHWWGGILSVTLWHAGPATSIFDAIVRWKEFAALRGDVAMLEACGAILPIRWDTVENSESLNWGDQCLLDGAAHRDLFAVETPKNAAASRTT